ncbi:hypothetical protein DERP_014185 [Dermatophagoides pteronyssinus]|uniref:Uncharacterized protein n=1 Tax=Dermatophagoides pteronyssinus TaxID=6956 RepID=A0ABQ8IWI2_DERPT|nr:hypothetical protein DERP_014185 [Dermatophagoides pteronyssinus]
MILSARSDHYLSVGRWRQLSPYCDCDNQLNLNGFFRLIIVYKDQIRNEEKTKRYDGGGGSFGTNVDDEK